MGKSRRRASRENGHGAQFEGLLLRADPLGGSGASRLRITLGGSAWRGPPLEHIAELPRLAKELLGPEIGVALTRFPEGTSLHVESYEMSVPWELIAVQADAAGGAPFVVGERFALTRWTPCRYATDLLWPKGGILVAPSAAQSAQAERRALTSLLGPPEDIHSGEEARRRMGRCFRRILHFACPCDDALLSIADPSPAGKGPGYRLDGSLVFLNARHTEAGSADAPSLAAWCGAFVEAGAGAVVACSWRDGDPAAGAFAEAFYAHAGAGVALGEAARRARVCARLKGSAGRLWARVLAAPRARLIRTPAGSGEDASVW